MRELNVKEILAVSGGQEEPSVQDTVVVTGKRIRRMTAWEISRINDFISGGLGGVQDSIIAGLGSVSDAAQDALPDPNTCQGQHLQQIADLQQERNDALGEIEQLTGPALGDQDPVQAQIDAAYGAMFGGGINSASDFHQNNWENLIQPGIQNAVEVSLLQQRVEALNNEIAEVADSAQSCGE